MRRMVKLRLCLAGMAVVLAGCGVGTSEISGSSTSVTEDATSVVEPSVAPTVKPPAPAPSREPAAPVRAPVPPASNPPPSGDSPTVGRSCEDSLERVEGLGALGADCETSRRVAGAYDSAVMEAGNFPDDASLAVADGWFCGSRSAGEWEETFDVLCDKGDRTRQAVTFTWGV